MRAPGDLAAFVRAAAVQPATGSRAAHMIVGGMIGVERFDVEQLPASHSEAVQVPGDELGLVGFLALLLAAPARFSSARLSLLSITSAYASRSA